MVNEYRNADGETGAEYVPSTGRTDGRSRDGTLSVLANERRRTVLTCMRNETDPVSLSELAERVAAAERDAPPPRVAKDRVERTKISLHHSHLPKLAEADAVEYDTVDRTVELDDGALELLAALDLNREC